MAKSLKSILMSVMAASVAAAAIFCCCPRASAQPAPETNAAAPASCHGHAEKTPPAATSGGHSADCNCHISQIAINEGGHFLAVAPVQHWPSFDGVIDQFVHVSEVAFLVASARGSPPELSDATPLYLRHRTLRL